MKKIIITAITALTLAGPVSAVTTTTTTTTENGWMWNMTPESDGLTATFWDGSQFTLSEDNSGDLVINWTDTLPDVSANWDNRIKGWIKGPKGCHFDIGMRPQADLPFWFVPRGDACHTGETVYFKLDSATRTGNAYVTTPHMDTSPVPLPAGLVLLLTGLVGLVGWKVRG